MILFDLSQVYKHATTKSSWQEILMNTFWTTIQAFNTSVNNANCSTSGNNVFPLTPNQAHTSEDRRLEVCRHFITDLPPAMEEYSSTSTPTNYSGRRQTSYKAHNPGISTPSILLAGKYTSRPQWHTDENKTCSKDSKTY
jgi:hypothetical protein